jgi:hypothetical protein
MLLPRIALNAARRPSRAATRTMVAVAGPGVSVTRRATTKPESTDWLGLIELGALEAAGMGADGRQGVERLRSPVKGPCEIKAR